VAAGWCLPIAGRRRESESPSVCPDVDVVNFQHQSDSTPEISSSPLKSESEKPGPFIVCVRVCVCVCTHARMETNPSCTVILLHDLEHISSL
jgi:hypothetical protein